MNKLIVQRQAQGALQAGNPSGSRSHCSRRVQGIATIINGNIVSRNCSTNSWRPPSNSSCEESDRSCNAVAAPRSRT
ncbi:hypothetical protein [Qaidamihabitans albus]|uniref:hypothetical protein n=1 Tax=Qaidamihabitans albus TaxID=2795733 RepID=UPI0018F124EE|nr:hypothetical protein [Qaidamihabitans albus]